MNEEIKSAVMTVTIPVDEYFDLRSKAETNLFLMTELGRIDARFIDLERRVYEVELRIARERNAL